MLFRLLTLLCLLAAPAVAQSIPAPKPNFVFILVDDFSMNLMPSALNTSMPNLAQMQADGVTFSNYTVTESRCCPSRSSILTGMLPHNTGVLTNTAPDGGLTAFTAHGNEAKVFILPLQQDGYRTAFMGKYLNEWKPKLSPIPPGWHRWVSTNSYAQYGYTLNDNAVISYPADYFTDLISTRGRGWMTSNRQPFFIELAPFAPHAPYVPAIRHEGLFLDQVMPKTPAYNFRPEPSAPAWLQAVPAMNAAMRANLDHKYILRLQSDAAIDEMIGAVRTRLNTLGIADNTYVIFTSDNGYHMGEFSMAAGKQTPFDFDIKVPMVIIGPGIAPGTVNSRIAMNIDIAPTILSLAGLPVPATMDGQSMFSTSPRTMAVVEHLSDVSDPGDPDYDDAAPPTYTALRGPGWMFVTYATGEVGYYDMTADPHQLHNVASSLMPERLAELHAAAVANATCTGAVQCGAAQMR